MSQRPSLFDALHVLRSVLPEQRLDELDLQFGSSAPANWPTGTIAWPAAASLVGHLRTAVSNNNAIHGHRDHNRLGCVIGAGGSGVVIEIGDTSALKLVRPTSLETFRQTSTPQEFKKLEPLDHEHIVKCEGSNLLRVDSMEVFAIRLERVDGHDLEDKRRLSAAKWPLRERLQVFGELCDAVFYLHNDPAARILHLDIKLDNLRQVRGGSLRLLDFGLARSKGSREPQPGLNEILGTAGYAAPEQCPIEAQLRFDLSPSSDIFSLGVVLFELTTGERFYEGDDDGYAPWLRKHAQSRAEAAEDLICEKFPGCLAEVATNLREAIVAAVNLDPTQRPESARVLKSRTLERSDEGCSESRATKVGDLTAEQRSRLELTKRETGEADTLGRALGVTGHRIQLAEIHLRLAIRDISTGDGKEVTRYLSREGQGRDFIEATKSHDFLLIKGVAGSGKTTVLRYLANALARTRLGEALDGEQHACIPSDACPEPLFIRLRDVVVPPPYIAKPGLAKDPNAFNTILRTWLHSKELSYPIDALVNDVASGNCILLLDGLDEVRDKDEREALARAIAIFAERVNKPAARGGAPTRARIIISSRPAVLENIAFPAPVFKIAEILPLKDDQIAKFAERWTQLAFNARSKEHVAPDALVRHRCTSVRLALDRDRSPDLFELAHNPMLLTLMVVVHYFTGALPAQRVALYDQAVDLLLDRPRPDFAPERTDWSPRRARELLAEVAWRCFDTTTQSLATKGQPAVEQTIGWVRAHVGKWEPGLAADAQNDRVDKFFKEHKHKGLVLVSPGEPREKFLHRSVREFLAGWWLANQSAARRLKLFRKGARDPSKDLHEALKMMAGVIASRGAAPAARFVRDILGRSDPNHVKPFDERASDIAAAIRLVRDMRSFDLPPAVFQPIDLDAHDLIAAIENPDVKQEDRIRFAEALGAFGDSRLREDRRWIEVEAGTFMYGTHDDLFDTPIEAYALARWPVTIDEYALFVEAGGYDDDNGRYWHAGRGKTDTEHRKPAGWTRQLREKSGNYPVTGVSWFEAKAYCAWLTMCDETSKYLFDLPSDAQWEAAARGTLRLPDGQGKHEDNPMPGRDYPWETQRSPRSEPSWKEGRANIVREVDGELVGDFEISPVGSFPEDRGPFGHWDLAGNVWEWCGDAADHEIVSDLQPYLRCRVVGSGASRVIRGGGVGIGDAEEARLDWGRCSVRYGMDPACRDSCLGFRPARVLR